MGPGVVGTQTSQTSQDHLYLDTKVDQLRNSYDTIPSSTRCDRLTPPPSPGASSTCSGAWEIDKAIAPPSPIPGRRSSRRGPSWRTWWSVPRRNGDVLQVNVRHGEFVGTPPGQGVGRPGGHPPAPCPCRRRRARDPAIPAAGASPGRPPQWTRTTEPPWSSSGSSPSTSPRARFTGEGTKQADTRVL